MWPWGEIESGNNPDTSVETFRQALNTIGAVPPIHEILFQFVLEVA